jgi:A/G-specific adenine glycosylase
VPSDADLVLEELDIAWLRRRVRRWFAEHERDFPWRRTSDPFEILIAELLLQRTRADLVPAVYARFIHRYPDARALAEASPEEVVQLLRPLGFVHRSARLPALARVLVDDFGGRVPNEKAALMTLPGVGRYVANAVLLVAFGHPRPLLDPNVIRLLDRCFGAGSLRSRPREDRELWRLLERIVPRRAPRSVAMGLIDLGGLVCVPRRPHCRRCPLRVRCLAFQSGEVIPREES